MPGIELLFHILADTHRPIYGDIVTEIQAKRQTDTEMQLDETVVKLLKFKGGQLWNRLPHD